MGLVKIIDDDDDDIIIIIIIIVIIKIEGSVTLGMILISNMPIMNETMLMKRHGFSCNNVQSLRFLLLQPSGGIPHYKCNHSVN